jgi:GNAT superfamily N-acetyltransferase
MDDCQPNLIVIAALVVDPSARRKRHASIAMDMLKQYARATNITLLLEATPMNGFKVKGQRSITKNQLINWYTRLGFKPAYPEEGHDLLKYTPAR